MGGNALVEGLTRRHNADEYFEKGVRIISTMIQHQFIDRVQIIESYRSKETFGDIDILYTTYYDTPLSSEHIRHLFPNTKDISRNGSVISFEFEEMQVDVIHVIQEEFSYSKSYFAWNDCGNLVGKLAHQLGLKHGHRGLFLPVRDGNQGLGEVCLTRDHNQTLKFLDLNQHTFGVGFDTLEDIFKFIRESRYFNPENYKLENLNTIAKIRDRKRSTYNTFLKYNVENPHPLPYQRKPNKFDYLEEIFDFFGGDALKQYASITQELAAQRYLKTKFNGDIVSEITGYTGKGLGQFMQHLKNSEFVLNKHTIPLMSDDQIKKIVIGQAENFNKVLGQ